jgi:hypothetical protein
VRKLNPLSAEIIFPNQHRYSNTVLSATEMHQIQVLCSRSSEAIGVWALSSGERPKKENPTNPVNPV